MNKKYQFLLPITGIKTNLKIVDFGMVKIIRLNKNNTLSLDEQDVSKLALCLYIDKIPNDDEAFELVEFLENALSIIRLFVFRSMHELAALNIISERKLWSYGNYYINNLTNITNSSKANMYPGGRNYEFRVNNEIINLFKQHYIDELIQLLYNYHNNIKLSEKDELIIKVVCWAGNMLEDTFYRDRFLRGITAIEALVEKAQGKSISSKFRNIGSNLYTIFNDTGNKDINTIQESLKNFYKARCNISHGGEMINNNFGGDLSYFAHIVGTIAINAIIVWSESNNLKEFYSKIT